MIDARLLKNSVLFRLKNVCQWGNSGRGQLTDEAVSELIGPHPDVAASGEAIRERIENAKRNLRLRKKLMECEQYDAIKSFMTDQKNRILANYCNPSFIDDGLYAVKNEALPLAVGDVKAAQARLEESIVPEFLRVYSERREAARTLLGEQFSEKDYLEVDKLKEAFRIEYRCIQIDVPEGLPPEIREEEEKKLRKAFEDAERQIVATMREGFMSILEHVTDRLQPGEDGKRKTFKGSLFDDFTEFVSSFQNRNIFNDVELGVLVERAKEVWTTVANGNPDKAVERLREVEPVREKALARLSEIKEALGKTITEMPGRQLDFAED